jgi:predicted RNA-binding protein with PUA-like domain
MKYYLMKSEPTCFSIDDLQKKKVSSWDGVRNYQARNFMMEMKLGDKILFYHSSAKEIGVVGTMTVAKEAYPDHTAQEKNNDHYDPKATKENPIWYMVDIKFENKFPRTVLLDEIKKEKSLKDMVILRKGNRLSITPVTQKEFEKILQMV